MTTKKFKIQYLDPQTEEVVEVTLDFTGGDGIPAELWAKDYAYTMADKGWHKVEEIK